QPVILIHEFVAYIELICKYPYCIRILKNDACGHRSNRGSCASLVHRLDEDIQWERISPYKDVEHVAAGIGAIERGLESNGRHYHSRSHRNRCDAFSKQFDLPMLSCGIGSNTQSLHPNGGRSPLAGRQVVSRITVRRFRCANGGCIQRIFCERLPQLSARAQSTNRLAEVHRLIGLALGGEAGSRLSRHLALPTSPDMLLRRVKRTPARSHSTPRVLGVDDFAFRRGESYGTILMDLEKRVVVELLPDRAAGTLATWLKAHPGVEIVSRDRASAYAQAAHEAAPKATQMADRFHLLMNLRKAVERSLARQSSAVRKVFRESGKNLEVETENQPLNSGKESLAQPYVSVKEQAKAEKRAQRQERFEQVRQLHRNGVSLRQISTSLRMHFVTVQKYVRAEECPVLRSALKGVPAPSPLNPFHDQIRKHVEEGPVTSARSLFRDLQAQGYPGGYGPVQRRVHRLTQQDRRLGPLGIPHATTPIPPPSRPIPSARRLSFAIARRGDQRSKEETEFLENLRKADSGVHIELF
ncbi:MAG: ISL3 family transposase, partial [Gemmataceae bacterium]